MRISLVLCGLLPMLLFLSTGSHAVVLATEQLSMPLAPAAPKRNLSLPVAHLDPDKQVWVSYSLLAASASEKATGDVVLDASFEGIPISLPNNLVTFKPSKLQRSQPGAGSGEKVQSMVGDRPPAELEKTLGRDLSVIFESLKQRRGSAYQGTIVKVYGPLRRREAVLIGSFQLPSDVQPLVLSVSVGQGEIPPALADGKGAELDSLAAKVIALAGSLIVALLWWRKRRQR